MPIDFYYALYSPPCRSIFVVAEVLNLKLNLKPVDMRSGEHLKPEFLKLNPQHTVPTLVDDGFSLWESRAILTYLVSKYGKDSGLYPEEPKARAIVDQRLYFDISTLQQRFSEYMRPQLWGGQPADEDKLKKVEEALGFLETFLEGHQWVAGDHVTVADYAIAVTVSNFGVFDIDIFKYPNIKAWYDRMKTTPGFSKIEEGLAAYQKAIETFGKK